MIFLRIYVDCKEICQAKKENSFLRTDVDLKEIWRRANFFKILQ